MQKLIEGYRQFRTQNWPEQKRLYEKLAIEGQKPHTLIVTCIDSRLDPSRIFDAAPGELLIVRNVANLVPPYEPDIMRHGTSAALEFGVQVLEIPQIVVMGHGLCGGVKALLEGAPPNAPDFITPWMAIADAARKRALTCDEPQRQECCEHEVVKTSLANLMTYPWIAKRVAAGKLTLRGAWFAIASGRLRLLNPDGVFEDAAEA
ncbi:MAG: carbonic anhydrase [Alphaproteobacteria bacterium]|nr:carbonic anhydrase [Alphaproteobacteria bacterium]